MESITHPQRKDHFAGELQGFGVIGIASVVIIVLTGNIFVYNFLIPAGAILVLLWVRRSRTSWREIGYVRPRNWIISLLGGMLFGITFKLVMKVMVMPML